MTNYGLRNASGSIYLNFLARRR